MGSMLDQALPAQAYAEYRSNLSRLTGIDTQLPENELLDLVGEGISSATIANLALLSIFDSRLPRVGVEKTLTGKESYFVYEMAFIYSLALVIFGNEEKTCRWLSKPKERFAGQTPVQLLDSENGAARITTMLIQIAEGYAA